MAIALDPSSITEEIADLISLRCIIKPPKSQYNQDPQLLECFRVQDDGIYIPLGTWRDFLDAFPDGCHKPMGGDVVCKKEMYTLKTDPKKYRDQDVVVRDAITKLHRDHTVFLACPPGFGKTSCGNYLACNLGLKTLVLCHISKVNQQWIEEFQEFSTAKVQYVKGKTLDPDADVYIMGVLKAKNFSEAEFTEAGIGTIIFDEAHVATITAFTDALLKVCPKYVIGLSATPERSDGMQKLISMYFGNKKNYIVREETKDFVVYKYETDFEPEINYKLLYGQAILDWSTVLNSLAYNEDRQTMISQLVIDIAQDETNRIMILSDRIFECEAIYSIVCQNLGEDRVYLMTDSNKKVNIKTIMEYQVLIAGRKRAGIGFNDPTRNNLVLCTDCKDVRQNEGRIRTVGNSIYDIVDCNFTLESHWKIRRDWYEKRGANIITWNRETKLVANKKNTELQTKRFIPIKKQ